MDHGDLSGYFVKEIIKYNNFYEDTLLIKAEVFV